MDAFHRAEAATLHNLAAPFRTLGDGLWAAVADRLSNREAAALACACRYLNQVARRRRRPRTVKDGVAAFSEADRRLLADVAPLVGLGPVREALRAFVKNMQVCVACMDTAASFVAVGSGQYGRSCGHLMCTSCWNKESTFDVSDTSYDYDVHFKCRACNEYIYIGDGEVCPWSCRCNMYEADAFVREHTITVAFDLPVPPRIEADATEKKVAKEVARRVTAMAKRFLRLQQLLLENHDVPAMARILRRELAIDAAWLDRAMRTRPRITSACGEGRFAWESHAFVVGCAQ